MKKLSVLVGMAVIAVLCGFASTALGERGHGDKGGGEHGRGKRAFECNGTFTGTFRDVVVPANGVCVLTNATVRKDVKVHKNAYFEADNTVIGGDVRGEQSETVFINTGSSVGGDVETHGGAQLFVFNSTVDHNIRADDLTDKVEVCGNTVSRGNVDVEGLHGGGNEILIGDPAASCGANTVSRGSVRIKDNFTDVDFVISGNTIRLGSLRVTDNTGTSDKSVQANHGGDTLKCVDNASPFVGGPNGTWASKHGQCV